MIDPHNDWGPSVDILALQDKINENVRTLVAIQEVGALPMMAYVRLPIPTTGGVLGVSLAQRELDGRGSE